MRVCRECSIRFMSHGISTRTEQRHRLVCNRPNPNAHTHTRTHATRTELNLERLLLLLFINSIIKVAVTNTIVLSLHVLGN